MDHEDFPPLINAQRVLAFSSIVLECAIMAMLSRSYWFPIGIVAVSTLGLLSRWRVAVNRKLVFDWTVLLWLALLAQYALLPHNAQYTQLFAGQQVAYLLAQFLMSVQAASFLVLRLDNLLPSSFAVLGAAALACLTIIQPRAGFEANSLHAGLIGYVLLMLLFWERTRRLTNTPQRRYRGRLILRVLTLVLIGTTGWTAAWATAHYETQLDRWVMSLLDPEKAITDIGFAETSQLGSVRLKQSQDSSQIALRVDATSEPGYFRGKAYDLYYDQQWHFSPSGLPVERLNKIPNGLPATVDDGQLYKTATPQGTPIDVLTVRPSAGLGAIYFAPLETVYVQTLSGTVVRDQHQVLRSEDRSPSSQYKLFLGTTLPNTERRPTDEDLLFVPRTIREDQRVLALRDELFRNTKTTRQKIAAVEKYFSRYEYGLTVEPPTGRDPVGWFLTERPAAHCEYFGTGTVMLLRLAGVPSRYVTGFVVDEQNSITGEWVARQKDAHAWAEAQLDDGRWEMIETTPCSGRPSQNGDGDSSELVEAMTSLWQTLKHRIFDRGIDSVLREGAVALLKPVVIALGSVAALAVAVWSYRRYRQRKLQRPRQLYAPHELEALLKQTDREVARAFRLREPHETLSQYAAALETSVSTIPGFDLQAAAQWYRDYERQRFQRTPNGLVQLQILKLG